MRTADRQTRGAYTALPYGRVIPHSPVCCLYGWCVGFTHGVTSYSGEQLVTGGRWNPGGGFGDSPTGVDNGWTPQLDVNSAVSDSSTDEWWAERWTGLDGWRSGTDFEPVGHSAVGHYLTAGDFVRAQPRCYLPPPWTTVT